MTIPSLAQIRSTHTTESPMDALYARLHEAGFDRTFVRNYVLPDWWEDSLAANSVTLAHAEISIARMLGFSIHALRTPTASLKQEMQSSYRLKRNRDIKAEELKPAIALAQSLGKTLAATLADVPSFAASITAVQMRQAILQKHRSVDLAGLLEWSWEHGIIVAHLLKLPTLTRKFDGIAMFCDHTPVVVLASKRDGPPWLVYHLAHELGHIMEKHVAPGMTPLLDSKIDHRLTFDELSIATTYDLEEASADQFALSLLTGYPTMSFDAVYGKTAAKLASEARQVEKNNQINAGTLALIYGRTAARMGVAQNALKQLALEHGAQKMIRDALTPHIPNDPPESLESTLLLLGWK